MTAKEQFDVELETLIHQFDELKIDIVTHKSQNVPHSNDAVVASVSGMVSCTTKTGGMESISQKKPLQTPCIQGSVLEKDLAVHDGQYTEGEHFQSVNDIRFSGSFEEGFGCVDLKKHKRFCMKQLSDSTEYPQDQFPKEFSVTVQQLPTRMLLGSQDPRFSAEEGLDIIESVEVEQKEYQQTQNGSIVTHPSENHLDAGEMSAINGGVEDLTKEKLRNKMIKNIKERKVLEGGTDVQAMTETGRQIPNMETNIETGSVNATIQTLEWAAGAGVADQNLTQRHQANMFLRRKPEKRKHEAELREHPCKKMRLSVSGDSTPFVSALPGPAIPNSVSAHMMDGEMKPRMVDDIHPLHKDATKPIEKDSAIDNQEGNMPDFSKLF